MIGATVPCPCVFRTLGWIPDQIVDRVFEPLFTTKEPTAGTGLGLSIVRNLVEGAGGVVQLERPEAGGTVFELFWPAQSPDVVPVELVSTRSAEERYAPPASPDPLSVLVIDDDQVCVKSLRGPFGRAGTRWRLPKMAMSPSRLCESTANSSTWCCPTSTCRRTGIELVPIWAEVIDRPVVLMTGFTQHPLDEERLAELWSPCSCRKPFDVGQLEAVLQQSVSVHE